MSVIIKGGNSNILADVDSSNQLKVNLPTVLSGAGYVSIVGLADDGTVTGDKLFRPIDVSQDYRLRTGIDKIIWQDTFSHGVLNNSKYLGITSTMTITVAGGFINLNAAAATASGNVARVQTFKSFSIFNTYPTYVDMQAKFSQVLQTNSVIEFGMGFAATTAAPTDGVIFRAVGGQLNAVVISNSNETQVANVFTPVAGRVYHFAITIGQDLCKFVVDDVVVAKIATPVGLGSPTQSNSLPLLLRNYNNGVSAIGVIFSVSQIGISMGDMDSGKDWATVMSTNGQNSIVAPDGQAAVAAGTYTANFVNNTAPALTTLTNTTSGYGPLILGGQFSFLAPASSENDLILFSYLNPAATAAIPGKTLMVTGAIIDTIVSGATVATTATVLQWSIGVGATAITLVTVDSVTAGTRAARRLGLGIQTFPIGSVTGTLAANVNTPFNPPLMVEAGTYCQIIVKVPLGTATAGSWYRGVCTITGYFE